MEIDTYYVKLRGQADPADLNNLGPVEMKIERMEASETLLSVCTDQSGLVGLVRHLHGRGLVILSAGRERLESWQNLYRLAVGSVLLQLAAILVMIFAAMIVTAPATVEEIFNAFQEDRMAVVLGDEFLSLVIVALYLGIFPGLYVALRRASPAFSAMAALLTCMGVTLCCATNSFFAMLHLSDLYAAAAGPDQRLQLLTAGQAVLAGNMWNSSGAYMSGIFLQGGGILISAIMLRSRDFSKLTAWAGILANGLDLAQHLLHPFAPALSGVIAPLCGLFYLAWLPSMARDLLRLARGAKPARSAIAR